MTHTFDSGDFFPFLVALAHGVPPHILFCYNLRFGSTPYQFYLNSSKMLISDSTIYRPLGSYDQKQVSWCIVMRGKFHKQQFLKLNSLPPKWFLGPQKCPCVQNTQIINHCSFLVPDNTQKILMEIWHHFWLKNGDEKWSRKNYFEIPCAPSEIPANQPG